MCSDGAVRSPRLSLRNRLVLRCLELRAAARFAVAPVDWAGAGRAILAGSAALGACHPTVHTAYVPPDRRPGEVRDQRPPQQRVDEA